MQVWQSMWPQGRNISISRSLHVAHCIFGRHSLNLRLTYSCPYFAFNSIAFYTPSSPEGSPPPPPLNMWNPPFLSFWFLRSNWSFWVFIWDTLCSIFSYESCNYLNLCPLCDAETCTSASSCYMATTTFFYWASSTDIDATSYSWTSNSVWPVDSASFSLACYALNSWYSWFLSSHSRLAFTTYNSISSLMRYCSAWFIWSVLMYCYCSVRSTSILVSASCMLSISLYSSSSWPFFSMRSYSAFSTRLSADLAASSET